MKFLSNSHRVTHVPGKELKLQSRPGLAMCVGFVFFALLTVVCLGAAVFTLQWGPFLAALVPGFWAWLMGAVVWMEWSDLRVPKKGDGSVTWRDGLKTGVISAEHALGAMVDAHVQPKLHKGSGPITFLGVWICDAELARTPGTYPWRRLFSLNAGRDTAKQVKAEFEKVRSALKELGYPDQAVVEARLRRGGKGV